MLAICTFPDGQRRTPVSFAAQRPVDVIRKPVAKAPFADVFGNPVSLVVQVHQFLPIRACADVPGLARIIQERRAAAPAERIGMRQGARAEQQAARIEILYGLRVSILDEDPLPGRYLRNE